MRQRCEICGEEVRSVRNVFTGSERLVGIDPDPRGTVHLSGEVGWDIPPPQGRVYPLYSFHSCELPKETALDLAAHLRGPE